MTLHSNDLTSYTTENFASKQLSKEQLVVILQEKEDFKNNYSKFPNYCSKLYPSIAQSWVKSRMQELNIHSHDLEQSFIDSGKLDKIMNENNLLIDCAKPFFNTVRNAMPSDSYSFTLSDKNGVLILREGTISSSCSALAPAIGTVWTEEFLGTNVVSLCRQLKSPIQLPGFLHYCDIFDNLIASACPILGNNGNIIAYIDLVRPTAGPPWEDTVQNQISKDLSLIITLGAAIESKVMMAAVCSGLRISNDLIDEGLIIINLTGKVTNINQAACQILKKAPDEAAGSNITEFLSNSEQLMEIVQRGRKSEFKANICIGKNEIPFMMEVRPIFNNNWLWGSVLKINQIQKKNVVITSKSGCIARFRFEDLIGESKEFSKAVKLGMLYARSSENVLLIGESGTGKELFAQAIHSRYRPNEPFIAINCAALPRNLIESELFGYEGGSFTGAERGGRAGKIELANGGTLFLDEIGEMPLEIQAVLLRVLEDKQVMKVGGYRYKTVDFRLIAATNKDLHKMVEEGKFRADLYYRLSVLTIKLPPLRQREDDVEMLTDYFIKKYCAKLGKDPLPISEQAMNKVKDYNWPGNVRQLENAIICAVNTEQSDLIKPESLPDYVVCDTVSEPTDLQTICEKLGGSFDLVHWEKYALEVALAASNNYIPLAADMLKISKSTMYRKLKLFNLSQ